MTGQPWYRHHPRDFLDGVLGLGPDTIGAYIVTLDLIYARGGPIPNDPRWISGIMGCSSRLTASLIERLIAADKLFLTDGKLHNQRAVSELENSSKLTRNLAEAGAKGGRTDRERSANRPRTDDEKTIDPSNNSDLSKATLKHDASLDKIREEERREEVISDEITARAKRPPAFAPPDWVPTKPWADWLAMRKSSKFPTTTGALEKAVRDLAKLADDGQPPGEVLEHATLRGWRGIFPIREFSHAASGTTVQRDGRRTGGDGLTSAVARRLAKFGEQRDADAQQGRAGYDHERDETSPRLRLIEAHPS